MLWTRRIFGSMIASLKPTRLGPLKTDYPVVAIPKSPSASHVMGKENHPVSHRMSSTGAVVEVLNSLPPPSLKEPPLMIEGDEFYVTSDGTSRTLYKFKGILDESKQSSPLLFSAGFMIEEQYNLKNAKKKFILRDSPTANSQNDHILRTQALGKNENGNTRLGPPLFTFDLQEIDHGVFGSAGTGSTTWESAIAMVLFFASQPHLLHGDILELGSGVGMGGILTKIATTIAKKRTSFESDSRNANKIVENSIESVTLTDNNLEVLQQCKNNLEKVSSSGYTHDIKVKRLDWYDKFDYPSCDSCPGTFRHIIASDCIYLHPDVSPLGNTISSLLGKEGELHMFGPYNRAAFSKMIQELRDKHRMDVTVNMIAMERFRIKKTTRLGVKLDDGEECSYASSKLAKFLYVQASHATRKSKECCSPVNDISALD